MNIVDFTTGIAQDAGQQLLHMQKEATVSSKVDGSLVTEADIAVDRFLTEQIQQHYPEDSIISEESTHHHRAAPATWVIDPLDGTTNFTGGLHFWGVSIARIENNQPTLGVLYFPVVNELYHAHKGSGAFENGKRLQTVDQAITKNTFMFKCSRTRKHYNVNLPCRSRMYGSAAYNLCTVARNNAILSIEITPKLWDFAASWIIVEEAGGHIDTLDHSDPFALSSDINYATHGFSVLAAANKAIWHEGQAAITPK